MGTSEAWDDPLQDFIEFPCDIVALDPQPDGTMRVTLEDGRQAVIYRAPDGSGHWEPLTRPSDVS